MKAVWSNKYLLYLSEVYEDFMKVQRSTLALNLRLANNPVIESNKQFQGFLDCVYLIMY